MYVRQNPNAKWFSLIKMQLYVYDLSGRDSSKWYNKFLRKIGDAPVIYNENEAGRRVLLLCYQWISLLRPADRNLPVQIL
jgi:hypothetical protein